MRLLKSGDALVLEIGELQGWFDQQTGPMLRRFRHESWTLLEEIDRTVSNLKASAHKLNSSANSDQVAQSHVRYAEQLRDKILSSLDKIQLPTVLSFSLVQDVYRELTRALENSTHACRVTVPHLDSGFKPRIIELDSGFKRLHDLTFKLAQILRSNQTVAQQIEATRRHIERATENQQGLEQVRTKKHNVEEQIMRLNLQLVEIDSQIEKVRNEECFRELEAVQIKIRSIKERFSGFRSVLNKPLKKLLKLVSQGEVILRPESIDALRSYVEDSTYTLLENTDLTHASLLLHDVERLLEDGKIVLEERKRKKVSDAVRAAQEGFLKKIHEEFKQLRQTEKQLISAYENSRFGQDDLKLKVSRRRIETETGELHELKRQLDIEIAELQTQLNQLSRDIEESTDALLGVKVSILVAP